MDKTLQELPADVLNLIFSYLDYVSLSNLRVTCSTLRNHVDEWYKFLARSVLVTNFKDRSIKNRVAKTYSVMDRLRISWNWEIGRYDATVIKYPNSRRKCMAWLQLTNDSLWLSTNYQIIKYGRLNSGLDITPMKVFDYFFDGAEVNKFVYKNDCIYTADSDGCVRIWSVDEPMERGTIKMFNTSLASVDVDSDKLVSCSFKGEYNIYSIKDDVFTERHKNKIKDHIWTISMHDTKAAIGTKGEDKAALYILDIESTNLLPIKEDKERSGVFGVKWEDPHILYTCEHSSYIKKWDLRAPEGPVQAWIDPFQEAVYSLETDNFRTLVSGAQYYGRIVLWDTRCSRYKQLYYLKADHPKRGMSTIRSPVYSLSFDGGQLFAATDKRLYILNFDVTNPGHREDYRDMTF